MKMKGIAKHIGFILALLAFGGTEELCAQANLPAQVQAVFIYNFTQFIDWPESAFDSPYSPLVIGVYGDNPFSSYLEETVRNERKGNHPIVIKYLSSPDEIRGCHLLFVSRKSASQASKLCETLKGTSVLTVSDAPDFEEQKGMIRLFLRDNKVRFAVNLEAVKEARLEISSKLLRLAEIKKT